MITLFRRIRRKLANENRFLQYSRYAIGEIVLVMVGILLALQVNTWNEERKERFEEETILKQLQVDFKSNLNQLDQKINIRNDFVNSSKQLFNYIDQQNLRNRDSIDYHIAKTLPYATFDPIIIDLASSGELSLIRNADLKQALTRWTSDISDVIEDEVIWKNYRNDQYFPFLINEYQLRSIRNKAFKSNILGSYSLEIGENISSYRNNEIGMSNHKADFNALLNHPNFEDHLVRCYAINSWANIQSHILRKRLVEIIELIESEMVE